MWRTADLVILSLLISAIPIGAALPKLDLPWILTALNRSCVVVGIDTGLVDGDAETYLDLLEALKESAFNDGDDVIFGRTAYSELTSDQRVKVKSHPPMIDGQGLSILVLERHRPDRSCLLIDKLEFKELKARLYRGRLDPNLVLQFVNEVCGTFKTLDGGLNGNGQKRNWILKNLHSVLEGPTMKTIWQKCSDSDGRLKEFFYTGECHGATVTLPKCETVDASELTKTQFLESYLFKSKPVVLKNLLSKVWPSFTEWTNDFFRHRFGNRRVHIKLTPAGEFEGVEDAGLWGECSRRTEDQTCPSPFAEVPAEVRKHLKFSSHLVMVRPASADMTMDEFIDQIENRTRWMNYQGNLSAYLEYTPVGENFVGFDNELPELPFVEGLLKLDLLNMWLSNGNTLGKLHFDQYDNFLCQIAGKKRLILFEPQNNSRLYEGYIVEATLAFKKDRFVRDSLMESTALTMAPVDIEKPDFKTFPEFANAIPLNCTIEPGDILFLPSFWWHEVQSYPDRQLPRNLAFNFWYRPLLTKEFPCVECKLDINSAYRHLL